MNAYIDPFQYLRAASGQDTSTVIGNLTRIGTAGVIAGATSIPLTVATTVALNPYDQITVFDGSSTEIAIVSTSTTIGATSIPVAALQYAHSAGTPIASDGTQGSLAAMIVDASAQIEAYCRQPLLQATHSNERLPLRSMRAAATRDYQLILRPKQFPVQSVSAVTVTVNGATTLTLDATQAFIDADAQVVTLAQMTTTGGSVSWWGNCSPPLYPTTPGWAQISYVAGYSYALLPYDVKQACIWMTSDLLSDRRNPTGAAELQLGKEHIVTRLRGETSGNSVLILRAYRALDPYRQRAF